MHLAYKETRSRCAVAVEHVAEFAIHGMHISMTIIIEMHLRVVVAHRLVQDLFSGEIERIITQIRVFEDKMGGIHTKPVYPPIQPEADDIKHGSFDRRISPVEVRLLFDECVQIILSSRAVPLPGRSTHYAQPIVGGRAIWSGVGPDIPITPGILA